MPARVIVQSGISEGTSHWIERAVVRIGSDPRADVCLPSAEIPAHALTLEYRDGQYRVYNRSPRQVSIGTLTVEPNAVAAWPDSDILQLDPEHQLILDLDDDPSPQPRPVASAEPLDGLQTDDEPWEPAAADEQPENEPPRSAAARTIVQLIVILACVAGCVLLLLRARSGGSPPERQRPFAAVVNEALASPATSRQLVQRLQYAEAAVVRGDEAAAVERFKRLRDDLLRQKDTFETQQRTTELAILEHVEYRLGQLE